MLTDSRPSAEIIAEEEKRANDFDRKREELREKARAEYNRGREEDERARTSTTVNISLDDITADMDTDGQRFIEGIVDEEQQRISRLANKAKAESDRAGEEKKHAAQVAKTKEIGLHYYSVRAVIEQARVKSIEESGQFAVIDAGEGPTVEDARTWHDMSGMEKLESMLYGIFQAGREIKP